jgi:predicted flap endonuclease-1-like 5' DNA nuclease
MLYIFGEIWLWMLGAFLLGLLIGWWIWARSLKVRIGELEAQLAEARRQADDAGTARTAAERNLAAANDRVRPLQAEIDGLKADLDACRKGRAELEDALAKARAAGGVATAAASLTGVAALVSPPPAPAAPVYSALMSAPIGTPDNLQLIKGVGEKLDAMLQSIGVFHFRQIANWSADDVAMVDTKLAQFKGRIVRDQWVEQANLLADGKFDEFNARFGELGSEIKKP